MPRKNARNTKGRIISAAWKLFYEQGYEDTTVEDIVFESETSKGSFYHYFDGKDALLGTLAYVFDEKYEELMETMDPAMNAMEKLIYLNHELFAMIDNSVSLELLARLFSSQLVTRGEKHLLDRSRTYFKLLCAKVAPYGFEASAFLSGLRAGTRAMVLNDGSRTNCEAFWAAFTQLLGPDARRIEAVCDEFYSNEFNQVRSILGLNISRRPLIDGLRAKGYQLVLANIVADVIIPLSAMVRPFLAENGVFICSGIIEHRWVETEAALKANGFAILEHKSEEEWHCFVCR